MKRNPESAPSGKQNGFTLVEIIVAMMVLSVGMLAMAASTGYVSSEIRNANWNTQRTMARARAAEQIQALPFDSVNTASTQTVGTFGSFTVTYRGTSTNNNLKTVLVIASGPAYRLGKGTRVTITDTVSIQIARQ